MTNNNNYGIWQKSDFTRPLVRWKGAGFPRPLCKGGGGVRRVDTPYPQTCHITQRDGEKC